MRCPTESQTNNNMKTKAIHLSLALLTITGATAQPGGEPEGHRPPPPAPLLMVLDTDHSGAISPEEIQNASTTLIALDHDGDGNLTREEMRPPHPGPEGMQPKADETQGAPRGKRPAPPIIAALDTDKDGTISAAEIQAAPESLKSLDQNGDGELSIQELAPRGPRPPRGDKERGDGPPPLAD